MLKFVLFVCILFYKFDFGINNCGNSNGYSDLTHTEQLHVQQCSATFRSHFASPGFDAHFTPFKTEAKKRRQTKTYNFVGGGFVWVVFRNNERCQAQQSVRIPSVVERKYTSQEVRKTLIRELDTRFSRYSIGLAFFGRTVFVVCAAVFWRRFFSQHKCAKVDVT